MNRLLRNAGLDKVSVTLSEWGRALHPVSTLGAAPGAVRAREAASGSGVFDDRSRPGARRAPRPGAAQIRASDSARTTRTAAISSLMPWNGRWSVFKRPRPYRQ